MKRSNHKDKRGEPPTITCRGCGHKSRSKYEAKNHVCRAADEPTRRMG